MKHIMVISDNPNLTSFFIKLTNEQKLNCVANFDYRYSLINREPESMIALGCKPINVKEITDINWMVSNFDLIFSIHCKQIFPVNLVSAIQCYNLHPGLNPHNRGWYPQVFSIINKKPIGATIHLMNEQVDAGPILAQKSILVNSFDTSLSVYEKVQKAEFELLQEYLKPIIFGEHVDLKYPPQGNYNSIDDFRNICRLDKSSTGTLEEHIDLLRALTHGEFNNAYFIGNAGEKIFVKISLTLDDRV